MADLSLNTLMKPSRLQAEIMDTYRRRSCLFVDAVAGSGKSTLLRMLINTIPENQRRYCIYLAFGKKMQEEMRPKLPVGVDCRTIHSCGYRILIKWLESQDMAPYNPDDWVDNDKYSDIAQYWCDQNGLSAKLGHPEYSEEELQDFYEAVRDMAHFCMVTLSAPNSLNIETLAEHFDVSYSPTLFEALCTAVPQVIEWGWSGVEISGVGRLWSIRDAVSGDDMLYWSWKRDMRPAWQYSFLFIDEAQDLSAAQREMVRRITRVNDRWPSKQVFVGDVFQAIFGFAGADCDSVSRIISDFGAHTMPLDVCYRCTTGPLDLASRIVPAIQPAEGAGPGEIYYSDMDYAIEQSVPGDMWMCRLTAPLVATYYKMIAKNKRVKFLGRDLGAPLKNILETIGRMKGFSFDRLPDFLREYRDNRVKTLELRSNPERKIAKFLDQVASISALYDALVDVVTGLTGMIDHLKRLFEDEDIEDKGAKRILLATAHRCKGLEADRTFILDPKNMPFAPCMNGWHGQQELNLLYVALTRTKGTMVFVGEGAETLASGTHPLFHHPAAEGRDQVAITRWGAPPAQLALPAPIEEEDLARYESGVPMDPMWDEPAPDAPQATSVPLPHFTPEMWDGFIFDYDEEASTEDEFARFERILGLPAESITSILTDDGQIEYLDTSSQFPTRRRIPIPVG